jgi:hypothetical protein
MRRFHGAADRARNVQQRVIPILPARDRPAIARCGKELAERCVAPVARTQDEGNDRALSLLMPLHRALHFNIIAIFRRQEVRADEEQDDVRGLERGGDLVPKVLAGNYLAVVPCLNEALAPEHGQMTLQVVPERLILMTIGEE